MGKKTFFYRHLFLIVLFLHAGVLCVAGGGNVSGIPEMTVTACKKSPLIDGVLTDACWQEPAAVEAFSVFGGKPGAKRPVQAWVTHDAEWLYIAFDTTHPFPSEIKTSVQQHGGPVHVDDSVEVFIDPGTDSVMYFHFLLNAANVGAEKMVTKEVTYTTTGIPWRSATALTDKGWSAEIAVPLVFLDSSGNLVKMRMNMNLNTIVPLIDPYGAKVREDHEYSSWATVVKSFHEPDMFGYIRGLADVPVRTPFFPVVRNISAGKYEIREGETVYSVSGELNSYFRQPGSVNLVVEDVPLSGGPGRVSAMVEIPDGAGVPFTVRVPVSDLQERTAKIHVYDAQTGSLMQTVLLSEKDMSVLNLMEVYLDRSYYTTEQHARAVCSLALPEEELKKMTVAVLKETGEKIGETEEPGQEVIVNIPLGSFDAGEHHLRISLVLPSGKPFAEKTVQLTKLPAKKGAEWKIDRQNRVLLNNGRPFFGFGLMVSRFSETEASDISEAGFNTVCLLNHSLSLADAARHRELAEKYNLYLIDYLDGYHADPADKDRFSFKYTVIDKTLPEAERKALFEKKAEEKLDTIETALNILKDSPRTMGYFTIDEPPGSRPEVAERGRMIYGRAKKADPYRPLFVNYSSSIPAGDLWVDWTDVLGTDPYWIPAGHTFRGTPNFVAGVTAMTDRRAAERRQVTWSIPMASFWSGSYKRWIYPQEQFCQTYLALIYGARIITHYTYPVIRHQIHWDALKQLASEIKTLEPVVTSPPVPQEIQYSPGVFDPGRRVYPDVHAALFSNPDGGWVLLCANGKNYPVDVTFESKTFGDIKEVRLLFDKSAGFRVRNGRFSDKLQPYGVRAYVSNIPMKRTDADNPVMITVATKAYPEKAEMEHPGLPRTGMPGKKNILPNPSFEETSIPDLPDYYIPAGRPLNEPPRIGSPESPFGIANDPDYAFHGQKYLRVRAVPLGATQVRFYIGPQEQHPCEYVLSVYMRSDDDNVYGGLYAAPQWLPGWTGDTRVKLTGEWQRLSLRGIIPSGLPEYNWFMFHVSGNGEAYVDAVQLERGSQPTEFEP